MRIVGRLLAALAAHVHGACGRVAYRLGCRRAARRHFERVLLLRGADFGAYVHLGRIAFDTGDYAGWRRELEHARRLDAERFARLRHPLDLQEPRLAGTSFGAADANGAEFDGTGERATWQLPRPTGPGRPARGEPFDGALDALLPGLDAREEPARGRPDPTEPRHGHDDCGSAAERTRFMRLGPIRAADVARCDVDDLARRLAN